LSHPDFCPLLHNCNVHANTLVLFNEAMVANGRPTMNIVEFKHALVHALVGIDRLEAAPVEDVPQDGVSGDS
jgi:hypothetical protein